MNADQRAQLERMMAEISACAKILQVLPGPPLCQWADTLRAVIKEDAQKRCKHCGNAYVGQHGQTFISWQRACQQRPHGQTP